MHKNKRRPPADGHPVDWRPPLQGRPPRRYGLLIITLLSLTAAAAIAWWLAQDFRAASPASDQKAQASRATGAENVAKEGPAAGRSPERSDQILRCLAEDGSVFYTNALSCAGADLENRVNVVPANGAQPAPPATECLGLADPPRAQQFLSSCQQPFNQALKLEPALARAADPHSSPRLAEYCELITAGVNAGCMATSATFCYLPLCQQLREQP